MMANSAVSKAELLQLGWDQTLADPVANEENKTLGDEVLNKQQLVMDLRNQLADHEDRIRAMCEHLKNVRQELSLTQGLHNSKKKEYETEDHLKKVGDREEGRLRQEVKKLQSELEELKERENACENNKFRLMQRLEEMKSEMDWDQQALQAWLEEAARKDEDAMIIEKYSRQDEAKIKELNGKISHMVAESQRKKRQLDNEHTETQMAQLELDKTAEEFRKAHAERHELLFRWQETIEQMQKRDNDMELLAAQLSKLRSDTRNKELQLKEKEQFYDNEVANNKEFEKKIGTTERAVVKMKQEFQDLDKERDHFNNELEVLKRTVDRTASDLETTRAQIKQYKREYVQKQERLDEVKHLIEELKTKLQKTTESKLTAEERSSRIEETLKQEERNQTAMLQEIKQLSEVLYRRNNELLQMKTEKRNMETEMQGIYAAIRNYNSKILQLDQESLKQMEILYNQNFNIQSLERRLSRLSGEISHEETLELDSKIKELTRILEGKTETHNMLNAQIKRLQDDLRKTKFSLERIIQTKEKVGEKIDDLNLQLDNAQKESKKIITTKQNLMVDENVMKLEVKRKRDALYKSADDVLSLEKAKMQMEAAMKERRQEISVHIEMLTAQIRAADAERQTIASELHERISRIEKLRKRFEIITISMAPPEGEEERSQAYYVIKAAQEKEELQREGDQLDASIRKAEKEIRALENTLRLMTNRNDTFRRNLNTVGESSDEMEQKQRLEEEARAVSEKFRFKRRQIQELQSDLQLMQSTMNNVTRDEEAYNESVQDKQNKIIRLQKELEEQKAKMDRVNKLNSKYSKEVRAKSKSETTDELDFEVRVMRDLNKMAIKQVSDAVQLFPEMAPAARVHFAQVNIQLPSEHDSGSVTGSSGSRVSSTSTPYSMHSSMVRSGSMSSVRSASTVESAGSKGSQASSVRSSARATKPALPVAKPVAVAADFVITGTAGASVRSSAANSAASSARSSRSSRR